MNNMSNSSQIEPSVMQNGLAMYSTGEGEPVLLMPYPHMFTTLPIVQSPLGTLLVKLNRNVITFDPPGAFRSTRSALVTMDEMLECAEETLQAFDIQGAVDVVGHSMGGLCALGYTLERPERVRRLVIVDSLSGGPAVRRHHGVPFHLPWTDGDFWRLSAWGLRLSYGLGNMAMHKRMLQMLLGFSYVDKSFADDVEILEGDKQLPAPVRDKWSMTSLRIDYRERLGEIRVPTLVCVGRHDLLLPVACSQELVDGLPDAQLEIFEESGHDPFREESDKFAELVGGWINQDNE